MNTARLLPALWLLSLPIVCAAEPAQKTSIESDLVLVAELKSKQTIQPGEQIDISLSLTNASKSVTHRVIKPGDGSSVGWRPPHLHFSVQHQQADGEWTAAPQTLISRCGLYDFDWQKDIVGLAPGKTLDLNTWLLPVSMSFDFQKPGEYRIRARYDCGPMRKPGDVLKAEDERPAQPQEVPEFSLISDPITITVERPLDVRLKVKRDLVAKEEVAFTDLFEATLVNQSNRAIEVTSPTLHADARIGFEIHQEQFLRRVECDRQADTYGIKRSIKRGEKLHLLGAEPFANGLDGTWTFSDQDTVKVRAVYHVSTWKPAPIIKSDWVEVQVKPNE